MKKILLVLILILTLGSHTMAYEEANYETISKNENYEIRKYFDRLVIETDSTEGNGFRKLFNYISGNNEEKKEVKMTVPVTQQNKDGNMKMQFYLPSKFNKDNAPKPSNPEIKVLNIEGGYYAVIKYSGRSSDKNFIKNKNILEKELKKDDIVILSPPIRASYNSPFTLPMLKRNEVMFRIDL
jgi:DNA gyrase inhibitor GyrI